MSFSHKAKNSSKKADLHSPEAKAMGKLCLQVILKHNQNIYKKIHHITHFSVSLRNIVKTMEKMTVLSIQQKNLLIQIFPVNIVNMLPHMDIT